MDQEGGAGEVGVQISHHVLNKRILQHKSSYHLHIYNIDKVDTLTQKKTTHRNS